MIRLYKQDDINGIIRLWEEAFGDTENEIRFFLDGCRKPLTALIYELGGEIASMLFLLEGDMHINGKDYPSYYLYAACTLKNYRGRGLMAELLDFAKEIADKNGKYFICLKPAEKSLFDFYEKHGYKTVFTARIAKYNAEKSLKNDTACNEIHPQLLRDSAFEGHSYFKWDRQSVEFAFLHNQFFGGNASTSRKGYSLYTSDGTENIVKETTFTHIEDVIRTISHYEKLVKIIFPPWVDVEGEISPYAMITAVNSDGRNLIDSVENAYLGLTLD